MREVLKSAGGIHGDISNDLDQGDDEEYDEEQGGQQPSVDGPIMVTPQKSKSKVKPKSKSNDNGVVDDDDEDASHHTAPMTPEASPSESKSSSPVSTPTAAAAATTKAASDGADANEIVEDLTRDESELENMRRQKELDQSWLSDGLQRPSATGVPEAPNAGELAAAIGVTAAAAALGVKAKDASHDNDDGGDDSSAADSHADSSTAEVATVSSLAVVSLTPSDASALHGDRNSSFTIMKDQLVASGGGDPFGEAGHESQKGGAVSHQVPVPSINFSSFKRKEKNIHLRPNCLTVEGVVGSDAAAIAPEPEDDNNAGDEDTREEEASPLRDDNPQ